MKCIAFLAWFDAWMGAYWNWKKRVLYLCPLPFLVFGFGKNEKDISVENTIPLAKGYPAIVMLLVAIAIDCLILAIIFRLLP